MFECPDYDGHDPGIHAWAWDAIKGSQNNWAQCFDQERIHSPIISWKFAKAVLQNSQGNKESLVWASKV